jgi:drug/metabolite transporter (DMT)-like permease
LLSIIGGFRIEPARCLQQTLTADILIAISVKGQHCDGLINCSDPDVKDGLRVFVGREEAVERAGRLKTRVSRKGWIALAFAAIYLIWGSTYLAIHVAVETMPPFLMAGVRFIAAGLLMYGWAVARGDARPTRVHWRSALVIGGLLLLGGNGGVTWALQSVPSGTAALLVGTIPLWMVLIEWLRPGGVRPGKLVFLGLGLGFSGIVLLIGPQEIAGGGDVPLLGALIIILAALSWATGSIYSRSAEVPESPLMSTATEMLVGGGLLFLAGMVTGEWADVELAEIAPQALAALVYLIIFGSIVAFTAYLWLLQVSTPARVSTYAFVNPVVAVFLGWLILGETLTVTTLIAAAIIVSSVVLITTTQPEPASAPQEEEGESSAP